MNDNLGSCLDVLEIFSFCNLLKNLKIYFLELTSDKESTMDQELANCNKVYDIAIEDKFVSRS